MADCRPDTAKARERALHALSLAAESRHAEAAAEADAAARLAPAAPSVHLARSVVLREAGRKADALRAADEALKLAPQDARAHRVRAAALASVGRLTEARGEAALAARLAPDDPVALRRLGDLAVEVDPAEAERHYRRGLRSDPHSAAAHAGLARALRRLGRSEEAEVEYDRAAEEDPAIAELRRRASQLLSAILQAAVATFLAILVLGWIPDFVALHRPDARGGASVLVALGAAATALAVLGWTAARVRRLSREAPLGPDVREDLRDIAELVTRDAT
jgi:Flp pilus assembly protein TadD